MIGNNYNNWVVEETAKEHRKQAVKLTKQRKKFEKGKKVTTKSHPNSPRCIILNYE
jgi:hypothetical protein